MKSTRWVVGALLMAFISVVASVGVVAQERASGDWRQWGGPGRNFIVDVGGLAERWPDDGSPVLWSRPLGTGHSSILAADGRLFTLYRVGNYVYGTDGTFGPAFMTGLDVRTGETVWQARGFARASLLHADGKTIIMDEDGDLALARLTPDGMTVLARASLFETVAWTAPTLVGTTLYVRDREKIVALDLEAE